jgi:hypothetical protein
LIGRTVDRRRGRRPFLDRDLGLKIDLDVEHTLPMQWGFTVRFRDYEPLLAYKPRILEFHFTDQDLNEQYPGGSMDLGLVVHAPEFFERSLVDLCSQDERQRRQSVDPDRKVSTWRRRWRRI